MVEVIVRENATKKYGAVTVTYKQNGEVLDGAPVEPGTYTFTAVVAPTATCAGGDVTPRYNTFTIQKAALNPADFTVTEPTDLTYDGKPKEVTVTNNSSKDYGKITVFYEMSGGKVVHGAPVEPGKYYYSVVTEGSARYKSGSVADGTFTITNDVKPDPITNIGKKNIVEKGLNQTAKFSRNTSVTLDCNVHLANFGIYDF